MGDRDEDGVVGYHMLHAGRMLEVVEDGTSTTTLGSVSGHRSI